MVDEKKPLDEEGLSYSTLNEGASDVTGVRETSGGAGSEDESLCSEVGRSGPERDETLEFWTWREARRVGSEMLLSLLPPGEG